MRFKQSPEHFLFICFMLLALAVVGCGGGDGDSGPDGSSQTSLAGTHLVEPHETDIRYAPGEKPHYIVCSTETTAENLFLFIGGSYSVPENYYLICNFAASTGFDVISLSYPNNVPAAPLGGSSDLFIFDTYRDEICFGNPVSDAVSVDSLNAIYTRTVTLLQYLADTFPHENWEQFLTAQNTPQWDKIVVGGHSQGAGHACYLGKALSLAGVLMFSGPNDYSTYYDAPGNWLSQTGQTPINRHFALLHVNDQLVPFANQVANLRGLGVLETGQDPLPVDNLSPPYGNAHAMGINIPAISNHNATVGSNSILPDIWEYMLGAPLSGTSSEKLE